MWKDPFCKYNYRKWSSCILTVWKNKSRPEIASELEGVANVSCFAMHIMICSQTCREHIIGVIVFYQIEVIFLS